MEDGGRQKVYGAGSCWNNTWQPEDTGVTTSSSLFIINNHMTSKGDIPLKWEPTHSLLDEGPDSSGPEARSE